MEAKYSTYEIRVRAVEAVRQGMAAAGVAKAYHVNRSTVHRWVTRYKAKRGNKGLVRQPVSGRPSILGTISDRQLLSIVLKPATHFGYETDFWTCPRLCQVIRQKFKVTLSRWTVWRWLRAVGLTYQKPRRKYSEADESKRQEWLKNESVELVLNRLKESTPVKLELLHNSLLPTQ